MTNKITKQKYNKMVFEKAEENHLWLNAFACLNPTDKLKMEIGEWVIAKLKDPENLIPSSSITDDSEIVREIAELTPVLYLSVNKS